MNKTLNQISEFFTVKLKGYGPSVNIEQLKRCRKIIACSGKLKPRLLNTFLQVFADLKRNNISPFFYNGDMAKCTKRREIGWGEDVLFSNYGQNANHLQGHIISRLISHCHTNLSYCVGEKVDLRL